MSKSPGARTIERSIDIAAPASWLFDLTQDYKRRLDWDPYLVKAELHGDHAAVWVRAWCVSKYPRWGMETEYVTFERDRSGGTDYRKSDLPAIRNARVADLRKYYPMYTPPTPDEWLAEMREVVRWVEKINARGGKVVFYREPVSGEHIELDETYFPRTKYWDNLVAIMPATMIDFRDYPELNIDTPDTSHIDIKDIDRHTRSLVRVLKRAGVL